MRFVRSSARRFVSIGLAVAVTVTAAVSIAWATIPDSSGVIHGCYTNLVGAVRVIDTSETNCTPAETPLDWNVRGPQGLQGAAGDGLVAYGIVSGESIFNAKGLTDAMVTHPVPGKWCFVDLTFPTRSVVVTPVTTEPVVATWWYRDPDCPQDARFVVYQKNLDRSPAESMYTLFVN